MTDFSIRVPNRTSCSPDRTIRRPATHHLVVPQPKKAVYKYADLQPNHISEDREKYPLSHDHANQSTNHLTFKQRALRITWHERRLSATNLLSTMPPRTPHHALRQEAHQRASLHTAVLRPLRAKSNEKHHYYLFPNSRRVSPSGKPQTVFTRRARRTVEWAATAAWRGGCTYGCNIGAHGRNKRAGGKRTGT